MLCFAKCSKGNLHLADERCYAEKGKKKKTDEEGVKSQCIKMEMKLQLSPSPPFHNPILDLTFMPLTVTTPRSAK